MKAVLEDIKLQQGTSSFYAYQFQVPFFEFKWHYHPEYELTYIVKGNGYRIVGNTYENYTEGDLVLLGPNLPHTWTGKAIENESFEAIVIQFSKEFITSFLGFDEAYSIKKLLENSARGIAFEATQELVQAIKTLIEKEGLDRILQLIFALNQLAQSNYTLITPNTFHTIASKKSELRINEVCLFIQNNFNSNITLKQVASQIYLTESNFCKFFKKATGKTFSDYLNEIRINEASRLLLQTDKTISQISFECGFETLSYFNRVFLKKKNQTPSVFRNEKTDK
jgi:AraC-like DNA-binding protein